MTAGEKGYLITVKQTAEVIPQPAARALELINAPLNALKLHNEREPIASTCSQQPYVFSHHTTPPLSQSCSM
jgi:hypothetical protein